MRVGRFAAGLGLALLSAASPSPAASPPLPPPEQPGSHESYVEALRRANEELALQLLARYERRIAEAPDDAVAAIERCRFLAAAFYDPETEENPREEERALCVEEVGRRFSGDPEARVFAIEESWGDEARQAGEQFIASPPPGTEDRHLAAVHSHLVRLLEHEDDGEAAPHAARAMELDPSLDFRVLLAQERIAAGERDDARALLIEGLLETEASWQLERKASLLADLEDYDAALSAFAELERRGQEHFRREVLARALVATGEIDAARAVFAQLALGWQSDDALRARFDFELGHGDAQSAREAYDALRARGWEMDPVGRDRLALLFAHPGAAWKWSDASGLGLLAFVVFALALLPALWILPVAWVGLARERGSPRVAGAAGFGLQQAWSVSALYLLAEGLVLLLHPDIFAAADGEGPATVDSAALARAAMLSFIASLAAVLLVVRRSVFALLGPGAWGWKRSLAAGVGGVLALRLGLGLALRLSGGGGGDPVTEEMVRSVNDRYGLDATLVLVALLVPLTEEIVFRGVLLSAFERALAPRWANLAQATLFGLAHASLVATPFTFAVGLVAGWMTRRSGTLRPALLMHVLNNAIACIALARPFS